jgi:hypothetical protein
MVFLILNAALQATHSTYCFFPIIYQHTMCLALVAFVASTSKAEEQNIAVLDLMFFSRSRVANPTCFDVSETPSHTLPFLSFPR